MLTEKQKAAQLCLVKDDTVFFTTQKLDDQWGDDWNDKPYEHNAGGPYRPHPRSKAHPGEWKIFTLKICGDVDQACEVAERTNRLLSVEEINSNRSPWLWKWSIDGGTPFAHAGDTMQQFIEACEAHGVTVYYPIESTADLPARTSLAPKELSSENAKRALVGVVEAHEFAAAKADCSSFNVLHIEDATGDDVPVVVFPLEDDEWRAWMRAFEG